jgi:hypothetical protein
MILSEPALERTWDDWLADSLELSSDLQSVVTRAEQLGLGRKGRWRCRRRRCRRASWAIGRVQWESWWVPCSGAMIETLSVAWLATMLERTREVWLEADFGLSLVVK